MSDHGRAFYVEPAHRVLHNAIGIGHALVLAKMIEPGVEIEGLDETPFLGRILAQAPNSRLRRACAPRSTWRSRR